MSQRFTIKDIQLLAKNKGGKCLSKEYVNSTTPLSWMCKTGHTWDSPYYVLQQGGWCPRCARHELDEEKFNEIKAVAKKQSIKILSQSYQGYVIPLKFECKKNHVFEKLFKQFIDRPLCYACYREEEREEGYKKMLAIAKERNGKFLSKEFTGTTQNHKWECNEGHSWQASPSNISRGGWCPLCGKKASDEKQRKNRIPELQKHAVKLGGKVISITYKNMYEPIIWQCKEGHEWSAPVTSVIHHGAWCRKCKYIGKRLSIDEFKKIAQKRKGKLLSKEYINTKTKLEWQCEKGHAWNAYPAHIKKGTWCPTCAGKR